MTTALVGLVGVIVGSALTALLNFYLQRAADQRRWSREDELQQQHWQREAKAALRAERISLYRDYIAHVHRAMNTLDFNDEEMRLMMYQIELLGSDDVAKRGVDLYFAAQDVWTETHTKPPETKIDEAMQAIDTHLYNFNKAVRAELGIPEPPPSPPPRPIKNGDE
jgi:hypothetical protein